MDKQKQIEEIDIILRSHLHSQIAYKMDISKFGGFEGYSPVYSSDMAKSIYNAGYRKIPENAVVLTQEMTYEYRKDVAEVKFLKKKIIKETAEKFAERVKDIKVEFQLVGSTYSRGDIKATAEGVYNYIMQRVDEICKELTGGK